MTTPMVHAPAPPPPPPQDDFEDEEIYDTMDAEESKTRPQNKSSNFFKLVCTM